MNSLSHYNLVHKFIPMPQAMKILDATGRSGEIMGKARENTSMTADESQKTHTLCIVDGPLSSQELGVGATVSKIQRSSRTPR